MSYPIVSENPEIQAFYVRLRKKGQTHKFAEMCAFRQSPMMANSDRMFLQDRHDNHGLTGIFAKKYYERARKAGIDTAGKVYMSNLADKRGPTDPGAWVSGVDDVRKTCIERGHACEKLGIKETDVSAPEKKVRLAEDLVQKKMAEKIAADPKKADNPAELREEVIETHGSPKE